MWRLAQMMQNCEQLLLALLKKDVHRSDLKGLLIQWHDVKTIWTNKGQNGQ